MQQDFSIKGFDEFLKTLNADRDAAAEKYVRLRERLERFFEWRNCENVEELTDIVFDRAVKKIGEGEKIVDAEAFCVGIAKYVFLESRRQSFRTEELNENYPDAEKSKAGEGFEPKEKRFKCLDDCMADLSADNRDLIFSYFDTDEKTMIPARKGLAERLGITLNTLRIKVCRLKAQLEKCTKECCENG